jgi:hypothetical protein
MTQQAYSMRRHLLRACAIGCAMAALLPLRAPAQRQWFVAPDGSDIGNECRDSNAPCATIAFALTRIATNAPEACDALNLAPGVYTEAGLLLSRDLIIRGAGPGLSIVQAAADAAFASDRVFKIELSARVRIEALMIRNGRAPDGADSTEIGGAGGNGGGILNNGVLELSDVHIVSNRAGNGGSGQTGGPGGSGGGIFTDGSLTASNVIVAHNRSGRGGGGTEYGGRAGDGWGVHNSGSAEFRFSTIHGNRGDAGGNGGTDGGDAGRGGVWNSGTLSLFSSTVHGNTGGASGVGTNGASGTPALGGGLWAESLSTNIIRHSTIAGNVTPYADAIFSDGGRVEIDHALIGGAAAGDLFIAGPSLVENSDDAILSGNVGALISGQNPLLGEFDFFGGSTPVRRLRPLSPAVNAGDPAIAAPPAFDQRGAPRIRGGRIDLGAYELQPSVSYVAGSGTDGTNECRDAHHPCATLAHAVAQALPGDEIALLPGVVTNDNIFLDRPLLIRGSGIGTSIWQGIGNRLFVVPAGVTGTVRDLTLRGGRAPDGENANDGESGGALINEGALTIERCAFEDHVAGAGGPSGGAGGRGGAIYNNGSLHIFASIFARNRAGHAGADAEGGPGGAIYNDATVHIRDSSFFDNAAGDGDPPAAGGAGGAIYNAGLISVHGATFAGNRSGPGAPGGSGGAIFNGDTLGATNITVSGNRAAPGGRGGGIATAGFLTLVHSTVASNQAAEAGGIDAAGPWTVLGHVLLAANTADTTGPDGIGMIDSRGWNLVGDIAGLTLTNLLTGNQIGSDPGLESLADNGGPTRTHALRPDSAARDAGDPAFSPPPFSDQRGFPRVIAPRIDIGAFEAPLLDSDEDGLPDYWEIYYGLDPFDPGITNFFSGANGDADGDAATAIEEYIAGTSPIDAGSVFRATAIGFSSAIRISFPSVTGRLYSVQRAAPGALMIWSNIPALIDLPGNGLTNVVSHSEDSPNAAYRLTVRLP